MSNRHSALPTVLVIIATAAGPACGSDRITGQDGGGTSDTGGDTSALNVLVEEDRFVVNVHLASDVNPVSPGTIGIVTWSIEGVSVDSAAIHFGLDDNYGMTAPVDLDEPEHRTLLLGMKPNSTYHFQVSADSGDTRYLSADYTVDTGPVTNMVSVSFEVYDDIRREPGFIVTNHAQKIASNLDSVAFIMDSDGDLVWWYESSLGAVARSRMSYDGKNLWMVPNRDQEGVRLQRVTMDTLETEFYEDVGASHDATPVSGALIAYIDYSEDDCGSVFEMDQDGEPVEIFESSDYLPGWTPPRCHLNALRFNEEEGLYSLSDRASDIYVFDRGGDIQWQLSDVADNADYGAQQHGHQLLRDSIILFANVGGNNASAVIEYALSDGTEIFRYDSGVSSVYLGDVQRLPGGNTLVTYSNAGIIHEVDPDGTLVMEAGCDTFGYASWRPTLYGPPTDLTM